MAKQIEGTWEEIAARAPELTGHRVRVTVLDGDEEKTESGATSNRTAQGAAEEVVNIPGLIPGRKGLQPIRDWKAFMAELPHIEDDEAFEVFERAIAENRAMRRALAQEGKD
jgi:hypothetical protein